MIIQRIWPLEGAATFRRTRDEWGIFSNFAPSPIYVNGIRIRTTEALYQACRFPHLPGDQQDIINAASPMTAKMIAKGHRPESRPDWGDDVTDDTVKIRVMRWTLLVKAQQCRVFRDELLRSSDMPIIEFSTRDAFWGATPPASGAQELHGVNMLGILLMETRTVVQTGVPSTIPPPDVSDFFLFGKSIGDVVAHDTADLFE